MPDRGNGRRHPLSLTDHQLQAVRDALDYALADGDDLPRRTIRRMDEARGKVRAEILRRGLVVVLLLVTIADALDDVLGWGIVPW